MKIINISLKEPILHKGEWKEDSSVHADAGYKGYTSVDQIDGQTLHIQIEDKVQTDL